MSLLQWCTWLSGSSFSIWLREAPYPYPVLLIIHLITIALFGGLCILLNLRVLGLALPQVPITHVLQQSRPWKWSALLILTITGLLIAASDPLEYHDNPMFWASLGVLAVAGLNAWYFHARTCRNIALWDMAQLTPAAARRWAWSSLGLWVVLIFMGRAIAFF